MNSDPLIEACRSYSDFAANQLSSNAWEKAPAVQLTRYWSGAEAPPKRQAEARIMWSDNALHVRFVCQQEEPLIVSANPQRETKTLGLWDRDVCEIFLAPDPTRPNAYFEFEAAPTGEWIDLSISITASGRETDWEFYSGLTAAGHVDRDRTVVGMRIPWNGWAHKPRRGEMWRVNLFRCVGSGENRGYLAWQPTLTDEPNFHVPSRFGWMRFG